MWIMNGVYIPNMSMIPLHANRLSLQCKYVYILPLTGVCTKVFHHCNDSERGGSAYQQSKCYPQNEYILCLMITFTHTLPFFLMCKQMETL